jgi:hypothetical protein
MREEDERVSRYRDVRYPHPRPIERRAEQIQQKKRSNNIRNRLSIGLMLATLMFLLISVGFYGYWNNGRDLIDTDTASYISQARYIQQNNVISDKNPNSAPKDLWYNDSPPGLPIIFSTVAMISGVNINLNSDLMLLMQSFSAFILIAFILMTFVVAKRITGDTRIAALTAFFSATFSSNQAILGPQYIVPSSFGLILMYLATYYLYCCVTEDKDKTVMTSKYTIIGALTIGVLILTHRLSAITLYLILAAFVILYILTNLGAKMYLTRIGFLVLFPLLITAPWWLFSYLQHSSIPWNIPQMLTLSIVIFTLLIIGTLFSGSDTRRYAYKRRDKLFAVVGSITKSTFNAIILLTLIGVAGLITVCLVFSLDTAVWLIFMISSLGFIPLLSAIIYKTKFWDRKESNLRNVIVSSWFLVALIPTAMGVLAWVLSTMPHLIQRLVPHILQNQDGLRSILYLILPLSVLASIVVLRLMYEDHPKVQGLRRRQDNRPLRALLLVSIVVITIVSPVFHIAVTNTLAQHVQDPKLSKDEMDALSWLNTHGSPNDGVLSDPTFMRYINTFTDKKGVISTDIENSYVVTHQQAQLDHLSRFMNSSTDSNKKLFICKMYDVKYFVYDKVKADYASKVFGIQLPDFTPDLGIMTEVYKNNGVAIYKIDQKKLDSTAPNYASIDRVIVKKNSAVLFVKSYSDSPLNVNVAWEDTGKPVTLNPFESKGVEIQLPSSSGRLLSIPTLGFSSSNLFVRVWDDTFSFAFDAVNINSQQLG